jgi:2-polyprenyl-3-methyl-5-hydroxy-6-metoxy-1,4-benzoquinol methylase
MVENSLRKSAVTKRNSAKFSNKRPAVHKDWYRRAFADDYVWLYAHRDEREAEKQVRTAVRIVPFAPGQTILDIACGAGRHVLAFALSGARVTGIDLSETLVKIARRRIAETGVRASILRGDMRVLSYREEFDGATIWFTSLGYFSTVAEDARVMKGLAASLKHGGWWLVDLPNPAYLEKNLVGKSRRTVNGPHGRAAVTETRRIVGRRVEKTTHIDDPAGSRSYVESVRLYRPEQFGALVNAARLVTDGILGDYDGRAMTADSPRQIWFGRKK